MGIEITELKNKCRVVTESIDHVESATVGVWVEAGSRSETKQQNGMAHFLEHMAFKGTKTRTSAEISKEIESVGGYLNASTGRETTSYYARVLSDNVPLAVDLISDILTNPLYKQEEIEVERGVIIQEINQDFDDPTSVLFNIAQECAYPDQSIGRPILGPIENIKSFNRQDFVDFVESKYDPERMVFAVAGKVSHNQIVDLVSETIGSIKKPQKPITVAKPQYVGGQAIKNKDTEQVHASVSFNGPSYNDVDRYVALVFSTILGGGMSSRLFQNAREKLGLCYSIGSFCSSYKDGGKLTVYAGTSKESVKKLLEVVCSEFKDLAHNTEAGDLESAKNQLKSGLLMSLESVSQRCNRLSHNLLVYNDILSPDYIKERLDNVSIDDLRSYPAKLAMSGSATVALYGPLGEEFSVDEVFSELNHVAA